MDSRCELWRATDSPHSILCVLLYIFTTKMRQLAEKWWGSFLGGGRFGENVGNYTIVYLLSRGAVQTPKLWVSESIYDDLHDIPCYPCYDNAQLLARINPWRNVRRVIHKHFR